jgi:aspartyl-tRNA(Asn)/glutamyl-tRNA(Gln) amidotransferase subunit A
MTELHFTSASDLARMIGRRDMSPLELMEATLTRIEALNPLINAFIQMDADGAMAQARAETEQVARGESLGPLSGLPFGVKELEDALGFRSTAGSRVYADRWAEWDQVHVQRLKAAGAIVLGKTNPPEFGYTAFTTNDVFGTTRNPWNLDRTPGGSSGGSAAAIAAGLVSLATASDGAGSIRIPASFVGAYGLKPTFGLVPIGPSRMLTWMDTSHYGALTRTVEDAALYLDVVAGYHPSDPNPNSRPKPSYSFRDRLDEPVPRLRFAYNRSLGGPHVQSDVLREVDAAVRAFEDMGHEVEENYDALEPMIRHWIAMGRFQALATMPEEIENHPELFTPGYAGGFKYGREVGAAQFRQAYLARTHLNDWLTDIFARYDLLLTPTMPLEAFDAEGPIPSEVEGQPLGGWVVTFTAPFNFTGHPAASVRAGFTDSGLPAGLQIVAERHHDGLVLQASRAYEQARPWNDCWPALPA